VKLVRYADRRDLLERRDLSQHTFPEYMHHNEPGGRWWGFLYDRFPAFQLALLDRGELVAEGHSLPVAWDGSLDDLPSGWDDAFERGMTSGQPPTALSALAISVRPERQGEGLAARMLEAFREAARSAGLGDLLAPVRPTWKDRYPLIPIERYQAWRREDGSHFDPWLRIHERMGGEIVASAPESMLIEAPVSDWEEWTGMRFPEDGTYLFPGALAPLEVRAGVGRHVEPNVWIRHRLS
jgi:GNAT superfamily N-acetyltransferase